MEKAKFTLVTIEYPPQTGGVARYLGNLVEASGGAMDVVDARPFFRKMWPQWWPLVHQIHLLKDSTERVLVSHVFPIGTAAWLSRAMGGPEYVVLFHGTDLRHAATHWKRWLLRRICANASTLICNSEATKRELQRFVPANRFADAEGILVLTPAVEERVLKSREEARTKLGIAAETTLILSIARLVPRKGIDVAIEAIAKLLTESGSVFKQVDKEILEERAIQYIRYVVIGSGPDEKRLQQLSVDKRVHVEWKAGVSDEEKWLWLAAADLFVMPGREEKKDVEGFGIVYLEAALAGVPSVAGKSGGVAEAVVDSVTGMLVDSNSIEEVASAVEKLLKDDVLRKRIGDAAQERAKKDFKWRDRWESLKGTIDPVSQHSMSQHPKGCRCSAEDCLSKPNRSVEQPMAREFRRRGSDIPEGAQEVSVVIPCYNHAKELEETLTALAKQTLLPKEIMVVDDFSADDPEMIVQSFNKKVGFLRLRHRHGAPYARNEGSRLVSSEYILFLDADTELTPDALETFVRTLEAHPECSFSYSNFLWGSKLFKGRPFDVQSLQKVNYITTASLIRRSAFPGFDESLKKFQDWDLWLSMAEKGLKGVWIDKVLFRVAPRKTGMSHWLPSIAYKIPWSKLGWTPKEVASYRQAEAIIRKKHNI